MTALLKQAVDRVGTLSPEQQDDFARVLLRLAGEDGPIYQLTPEEDADLIAADAEIDAGDFATEAEVDVVFSAFRV